MHITLTDLCLLALSVVFNINSFFVVVIYHYNPSGRAVTLESTQPLTEMSLFLFASCGAAAQRGPWPPHSLGF